MLIWRGWGLMVLVLGVLGTLVTQLLVERYADMPGSFEAYRDAHRWVWLVSLGSAAAACWWLGQALEARALKRARVLTDAATGEQVQLKGHNDFFWVPIKWWALVYLALAAWFTWGV